MKRNRENASKGLCEKCRWPCEDSEKFCVTCSREQDAAIAEEKSRTNVTVTHAASNPTEDTGVVLAIFGGIASLLLILIVVVVSSIGKGVCESCKKKIAEEMSRM